MSSFDLQQTQLPSDAVPLSSQRVFCSGTTITVMEDYVIKHVDLQEQRHLVDQLSELQKMYKATAASQHLIRSKGGPYIRTKYTVSLYPVGEQLWPENIPTRITSLAQLQAAIRCTLLALKGLHAANFAHTDIRWPNVIKCSNNTFCLIDLETAVELGCKWSVAKHGPRRICWPEKILTRGKYTEKSDLMLVGQMLKQPELPSLNESGDLFAKQLLAKSISVESALHHVWLGP